MKHAFFAFSIIALAACTQNRPCIVVENSTDRARNEVVAVPLADIQSSIDNGQTFVILDADGKEVKYQITNDEQVIFVADAKANSQTKYTITAGTPTPADTVAVGHHYPERVDDIAWENDRIAFRTYGPALQASGERAFGYDIWLKSVPEPVVDARYKKELCPKTLAIIDSLSTVDPDSAIALRKATSYHYDHGNGMDCYKVGPTLGGGTAAIMIGDSIVYPYCYKDFEILDNGPLRFTVRLTYNPTEINGRQVVETRIISIDALSQLNKTIVRYSGIEDTCNVAAGIVLHHADGGENAADSKLGYIAYADPSDNPDNNNGTIFVGAIVPQAIDAKVQMFSDEESRTLRGGANGHVLCIGKCAPGEDFVYYWGGAWNRYGFESFGDWKQYLETFVSNIKEPLKTSVMK